ncbi:MAG: hypothetical protein FH759_08260 [Sediminimonas qiaohouensis]|uniref:Uncharacterized protein n=1 Tax=Sediminimonas qiaohouensis TaxID=552061 RepID=A0A7C9HLU1_9RHOB|nr:hypothetical protein [Sediminimonas qiaohouensis]
MECYCRADQLSEARRRV